MTQPLEFEVGKVVFAVPNESLRVNVVIVSEVVIQKRLTGIETTYLVQDLNGLKFKLDLKQYSIFNSLDDVQLHLMSVAETSIEKIMKSVRNNSEKLQSSLHGKKDKDK